MYVAVNFPVSDDISRGLFRAIFYNSGPFFSDQTC